MDFEQKLDDLLKEKNNDRVIIGDTGDSSWGQLILPAEHENPSKTDNGIKILLFASYKLGYLLLKTLIEIEKRLPNTLNIVGLVTDDPVSSVAKISKRRRIWRLFDDQSTMFIEDAIIEEALSFGIPCYTGAVKTNYFRTLLKSWNPHSIQVCVFGQIIDGPIINYPKMGIYNYHPADLLHNLGAGPQPFQDLINRNADTSKFTIHQLTEQLDSGPVLGQSPIINVRNTNNTLSHDILVLEDKMTEPLGTMASVLTYNLIKNYNNGENNPINNLNFESYFSDSEKKQLLKPIEEATPDKSMPKISKFTTQLLDKLFHNENTF